MIEEKPNSSKPDSFIVISSGMLKSKTICAFCGMEKDDFILSSCCEGSRIAQEKYEMESKNEKNSSVRSFGSIL